MQSNDTTTSPQQHVGSTAELGGLVALVLDMVEATKEIRTWGQGYDDHFPDLKFSGPWPQPVLIKAECDLLRRVYATHASTLETLLPPNTEAQRAAEGGPTGAQSSTDWRP